MFFNLHIFFEAMADMENLSTYFPHFNFVRPLEITFICDFPQWLPESVGGGVIINLSSKYLATYTVVAGQIL